MTLQDFTAKYGIDPNSLMQLPDAATQELTNLLEATGTSAKVYYIHENTGKAHSRTVPVAQLFTDCIFSYYKLTDGYAIAMPMTTGELVQVTDLTTLKQD